MKDPVRLDIPLLKRPPSSQEWLITNGIGGFGMGTLSGEQTRRYHALLIAALAPPLGRTVMLSAVQEQLAGTASLPHGPFQTQLEHVHLEGTVPVWTCSAAGGHLQKRIWMPHNENATCVEYRYDGDRDLSLDLHLYVHFRDFHENTKGTTWPNQLTMLADGFRYQAYDAAAPLTVTCPGCQPERVGRWIEAIEQSVEAYRGLDHLGSHFHAVTFHVILQPGVPLRLSARVSPAATPPTVRLEEDLDSHNHRPEDVPAWINQLMQAADQFIVARPLPGGRMGTSIIAGYPWFGDWGRDTMISLPGLLLSTGHAKAAGDILRTFARFIDKGMLPNRFPDDSGPPEYNTVDATLWYFDALSTYMKATGDESLLKDVYASLEDILAWHQRGTRYGIQLDRSDSLLRAGEPGVQLTWMDAKVGDWVVTPRQGKAVEINALWYHALKVMAEFAVQLGRDPEPFQSLAASARTGFQRFWNDEQSCCFDVLDAPTGDLAQIRPNQLIAVALEHSPLSPGKQRAIVDCCQAHLLTPFGLRSLSPHDSDYIGTYGGDRVQRDGAYHQGTVWAWLIEPFIRAHLRVYNDPERARAFLLPFADHLHTHGVGTVSEIFDGNPPHEPRGCPAQAWSVAAVLRSWYAIESWKATLEDVPLSG